MRRNRKIVNWKDGTETVRSRLQYPFSPNLSSPEVAQILCDHLVPGALWITRGPLQTEELFGRVEPHEFKYLVPNPYPFPDASCVPPSTFAVYAGELRVSEVDARGATRRTPRHTFIIGGARYMTRDLGDFTPIKEGA